MKKKILALAALVAVATACSKSDEAPASSSFPTDGVIRVATHVNAPQTRAGLTTQNLDNMGFHVVNSISAAYSYSNVKMSYVDSDWTSSKTMLWQNSSQVVKIMAYSPYVEGANDIMVVPFGVKTDQRTAENVKVSDFVYQTIDFIPSRDLVGGRVKLNLHHVMSKLIVNITFGNEFELDPGTATNPIESVTVNGTKVNCIVDFQNNAHVRQQDLRDDSAPILMYHEGYAVSSTTAEYQCILLPQMVVANALTIDIFVKGKGNYKYTLSNAQTFAVDKIYTLTLNVGKDVVTAGNMTMTGWEPGNGNGGNYETD